MIALFHVTFGFVVVWLLYLFSCVVVCNFVTNKINKDMQEQADNGVSPSLSSPGVTPATPGSSSLWCGGAVSPAPPVPSYLGEVIRSFPRLRKVLRRVYLWLWASFSNHLKEENPVLSLWAIQIEITRLSPSLPLSAVSLLSLLVALQDADRSRCVDSRYLPAVGLPGFRDNLILLVRSKLVERHYFDIHRPHLKQYRSNVPVFLTVTPAGRRFLIRLRDGVVHRWGADLWGWLSWGTDKKNPAPSQDAG